MDLFGEQMGYFSHLQSTDSTGQSLLLVHENMKNWKEVCPRENNGVPSHIFLLINILYFLFLDIIKERPTPSSLHSGPCDNGPFIPSSGY